MADINDPNPDPKDVQKQNQPALNIFRRCVSYKISDVTWTLITKSPDFFLHVKFKCLHGWPGIGSAKVVSWKFGIKEFRVRNLAASAPWPDVIARVRVPVGDDSECARIRHVGGEAA